MAARNLLVWFALVLLAAGCARFAAPDIPEQKAGRADAQLERFSRLNKDMPPYKGTGELRFQQDGKAWSMRGAWLAVPPDRFRVETIGGVAGQPGTRLICDPAECHLVYFEDGCFRKISTRNKNLGRLAGIDMDVADLVLLLGGGLPIVPHDDARVEEDIDSFGAVMKLTKRFHGDVEKIYFSTDMSHVRMVEVFGFRELKYRATVVSTRMVDGYRVPEILHIENDNAEMELNLDRAWFDVDAASDAFVPDLPEDRRCD